MKKIAFSIWISRQLSGCLATALVIFGCSKDANVSSESLFEVPDEIFSPIVAFVGVNVVPMDSERVLRSQTVVVRDRRIVEIGPSSTVAVADSVPKIRAPGAYLMPGLADMHVHLISNSRSVNDLLLFVANGVTTVRSMWGFPLFLAWRDEVEADVVVGPRIYQASPGFEGSSPVHPGSVLFSTPAQARQAVISQKDLGYDFIKVYNNPKLDQYDAIIAEAEMQQIKVVGHIPFAVSLTRALSAGHYSIEHLIGYNRALGVGESWGGTINRTALADLADMTRQAGVWNSPTITVDIRTQSRMQEYLNHPGMRYVSPAMISSFQTPVNQPPNADFSVKHANLKIVVKALRDAGARLLLSTDAGFRYVLPGYSIHEELGHRVDAGLTPYEALRSGTIDAAEFLGADHEFGTVSVGKKADLILLDGNPLENVAHANRRIGVMRNGRWFSQGRLNRMLENLASSYGR